MHAPRALLAVALLFSAASAAEASCSADRAEFRWEGGGARFTVELADDAAERAKGLMFRERLSNSEGMLFVYDRPQPVSFWMRNTLIPLDMIFMDATGQVVSVHPNAVPGDETPIPGGEAIQFVLEINGGLAGRLGLTEGAELRHPAIDQTAAAWPCS